MKLRNQLFAIGAALAVMLISVSQIWAAEIGNELLASQLSNQPRSFSSKATQSGDFTWWLPQGGDSFVLPMSAGVVVDATNAPLMRWLKDGSPWDLTELPIFGVRYGERTALVIVPWPHYAELVIGP